MKIPGRYRLIMDAPVQQQLIPRASRPTLSNYVQYAESDSKGPQQRPHSILTPALTALMNAVLRSGCA